MDPKAPPDKHAIRRSMRHMRQSLSAEIQKQAAEQICQHFCNLSEFRHSQHIATYWAHEGEVDTTPIIHKLWQQGKRCYLPLLEGNLKHLSFANFNTQTLLQPNRFGIPEPKPPNATIPPQELDLVLLPLVAFDSQGNRLGMGAGYYDQTFAFIHATPLCKAPILIGLAYEAQCLPSLPHDVWDIPLQGIVTESGFRRFK